jgi:hypothetical protein
LLVLVSLLSCRPSSTSESPGTPNGQTAKGEADARRATLSKDEMIQTAKRGLRDPNGYAIHYDEDNQLWHRCFTKPMPELEGHDYQVIQFFYDQPGSMSTPVWILIDKKTGTILKKVVSYTDR